MAQSDPRPARDRDEDAKPRAQVKRTPSAEVQPADAGTAASGNEDTPALPEVKQSARGDDSRRGRQH